MLAILIDTNMEWQKEAICKYLPPAVFFPTGSFPNKTGPNKEEMEEKAARICHGLSEASSDPCPVREQCLEYAIRNREAGVWGGTTEEERIRIAKRRRQNN